MQLCLHTMGIHRINVHDIHTHGHAYIHTAVYAVGMHVSMTNQAGGKEKGSTIAAIVIQHDPFWHAWLVGIMQNNCKGLFFGASVLVTASFTSLTFWKQCFAYEQTSVLCFAVFDTTAVCCASGFHDFWEPTQYIGFTD